MREARRRPKTGLRVVLGVLFLGIAIGCAASVDRSEDITWRKARVRYDMGVDHLAKGRVALAIREFQRAQELDSTDPWISVALAEAYRRRGVLEDAEQQLRRALKLEPELQAARLNLGALYIQMERYEDAIAQIAPLVEDPTFPAPWDALTNLGWAYFKLGKHAEARRHLERAVDFQPNYWKALLNLGILEAHEGHRLEALQLFEQVLEQNPGPYAEAEAHYRMAEIYISLGQRDQAIEHLSASRERHPRGTWGKRSAEYLEILR